MWGSVGVRERGIAQVSVYFKVPKVILSCNEGQESLLLAETVLYPECSDYARRQACSPPTTTQLDDLPFLFPPASSALASGSRPIASGCKAGLRSPRADVMNQHPQGLLVPL